MTPGDSANCLALVELKQMVEFVGRLTKTCHTRPFCHMGESVIYPISFVKPLIKDEPLTRRMGFCTQTNHTGRIVHKS